MGESTARPNPRSTVLCAILERTSVSSVLIDAAEAGFVDLTVIERLGAAHDRLNASGGGLIVIDPPEGRLRPLEVLDEVVLPIVH